MKALTHAVLASTALPLFSLISVAACASEPQDDGASADKPEYEYYLDAPQTPGTWEYVDEPGESLGLFGIGNPVHPFVLRCDKERTRIGIARRSERIVPLTITIETETVKRELVARPVEGYGLVAADVDPADPLLDAMAITKGRFAVSVDGEETLYVPAWAEVTRVIEDCR